jgi:two-component system, OmpR family, KDP operon response regulator KdpE
LGTPSDPAVGNEVSLTQSAGRRALPANTDATTVSTRRPDVVVVHAGPSASEELIDSLRAAEIRTQGLTVDRELIAGINALEPQAVVVDHSIGFDLVRVCRDIRSASTARIIAISDDGPEDDPKRIAAFAVGVDDCLERAGAARRVMARVLAVLTRGDPPTCDDVPGRVGDMQLDFAYRDLLIGGQRVVCSEREFGLIEALAERPNKPVTHDELITKLWGPNAPSHYRRRLRIVVSRIRKLIGQGPNRPSIVGVLGVGYQLLVPSHDVRAEPI